jgi:hypothetical protein
MKFGLSIIVLLFINAQIEASQDIYLLSKRTILDTTNTLAVLFHDPAISTMEECQREIQRGNREQWRFYHHSFPRPLGASENRDYLCISGALKVDPWDKNAPYDLIYLIDVRAEPAQFTKMANLARCLSQVSGGAKGESRKLFCGKLSQQVKR